MAFLSTLKRERERAEGKKKKSSFNSVLIHPETKPVYTGGPALNSA